MRRRGLRRTSGLSLRSSLAARLGGEVGRAFETARRVRLGMRPESTSQKGIGALRLIRRDGKRTRLPDSGRPTRPRSIPKRLLTWLMIERPLRVDLTHSPPSASPSPSFSSPNAIPTSRAGQLIDARAPAGRTGRGSGRCRRRRRRPCRRGPQGHEVSPSPGHGDARSRRRGSCGAGGRVGGEACARGDGRGRVAVDAQIGGMFGQPQRGRRFPRCPSRSIGAPNGTGPRFFPR